MKTFIKSIALAGIASGMLFAAPGLVVNGMELQYNGKKIFFSGTNLAWADYNSDVGDSPLNENAWRKAVEGTRAAGGNAIRWWLFNNMSQSPSIDPTTHLISGLKENTINNMKKALDIAEEYGVMVSMCLFSHNLMEPEQWGLYENDKVDITANTKLFDDEGTEAFIQKVLLPVVKAIGNHNALMTWEVFNEPEGMAPSVGWTKNRMEKALLQKFTNKVAAAIHTENPDLLVSTGSVNIQYQNWWNDSELIAAGGESNGTLDFFQTHYYPYYQKDEESPFRNSVSSLAAKYHFDSKPLIIGEFPASGWAGATYTASMAAKTEISTTECYRLALDSGYAGALAWQYIGDKTESQFGGYTYTIDPALNAMTALWQTDSSLIKIKGVEVSVDTGNGMMAVTYGDDNAQIEYQKSLDLSGASTLSFTVKNNSTAEADLYLIFKLTSAWTWTETDGSCKVAAGEKKICSFDISGLADRKETMSIIFANYAKGFTGTLLFDDVMAGNDTLFHFNKDKYDAFSRSFGNTEQQIPEIKIVFNNENYVWTGSLGIRPRTSFARIQGNDLHLSVPASGFAEVSLFALDGSRIQTLFRGNLSAGSHEFKISAPKGVYLLRAKGLGYSSTQKMVVSE